MKNPFPRFADGQLDDVSSVLAKSHPRAAQYVEQAPALAVIACKKLRSHITYGEIDHFASLIAPEPKLRDVLTAYGAPLPVRKLSAAAIKVRDGETIEYLGRIDAPTLSQIIPDAAFQGAWLDGIRKWLVLTPNGKAARAKFSVAWIARRLCEDTSRVEQVDTVVDFIRRGDGAINERWSWARALEAVAAWHARLNDEQAIRRALQDADRAAKFDVPVCNAPLPDIAEVDGFEFAVLRTPRHIQDEGVVMHHCVSSYVGNVKRGQCAIISIRRQGVNVATLEISRKGVVSQIKTHCNGAPSVAVRKAADLYALRHWAPPEQAA